MKTCSERSSTTLWYPSRHDSGPLGVCKDFFELEFFENPEIFENLIWNFLKIFEEKNHRKFDFFDFFGPKYCQKYLADPAEWKRTKGRPGPAGHSSTQFETETLYHKQNDVHMGMTLASAPLYTSSQNFVYGFRIVEIQFLKIRWWPHVQSKLCS